MPSTTSRAKTAAVAVSLFALASAGKAAVQCHLTPPFPVPVTTAGLYINLVTGTATPTPGASPGWDFNPWGSSALFLWFNNGADPSSAGAVAVGAAPAVLASGATVDAAQLYTGETPTPTTADWRKTNTGQYLGIRFWNEGTAAINYGWMQIDTVGATTGLPATVQSWCYEDSGAGITTSTTPVELQTFSVE